MTVRGRSRGALCLALSVLCLGVVPGVGAAATKHPFFGSITGEKAGPNQQFKDACGVTVDSHGAIYVADYYQNRIVVLDANHEFLTQIEYVNPLDSGGVAPIDGPCDLAVDAAGRLYVNDYHRDVVSFTPSKYPLEKGTSYGPAATIDSSHPTGVAVDPASGDVYVDERTSVALYEAPVTPGEEPSLRIGLGSLEDGYGVAVSGFAGSAEHPSTAGRVYVADAATGTVKVYDSGAPSSPVEEIGGEATPRAGFHSLVDADLAIDPADGHLYLVDDLRPHFEAPEAIVYEFSAAGNYRGQLPSPVAEGESSFLLDGEPSGIALGSEGRIYVTSGNFENAAVLVFGPAPFAPTQVLAVTKGGSGSGVLASSPPGLRCGGACEGEFERDSSVTLFAIPQRGSRLAGWSGCGSEPSASSCTVTMAADRTVSAEFEAVPQQQLSVTASGTGAGVVSSAPAGIQCGAVCEIGFDEGSTVTLSAAALAGSRLAGWSGCGSEPSASSCRVTMSAAHSVSAEFEALPEEGEASQNPGPGRLPIPTVPLPAALPSPGLRVGEVVVTGTIARLRVAVPGPGSLSASGKRLRPSSKISFRAGESPLVLRLNGAGERALARDKGGKLAVRVKLAFAPLGEGASLRAAKTVTFRQGAKR
jgi:DNA-binding beta-propeller fold protein YncE